MTISVPANLSQTKKPKTSAKGSPAALKPLEPAAAKTKLALNVNLNAELKTAIHMESVQRGISMTKLLGEMWEAYLAQRHS
ncbi:hypothetical protein AB9U01_25205 [Pseudomonas qingdaonensis]|uniref:hypothetical protein n=1 Tax=Pseudomonas qingdaonensis TaxID=2056231 RepID=UPI003514C97B